MLHLPWIIWKVGRPSAECHASYRDGLRVAARYHPRSPGYVSLNPVSSERGDMSDGIFGGWSVFRWYLVDVVG